MSTDLSNNAAPLKAGLNEGAAKRMAEMVNLGRQASSDSINSGLTCTDHQVTVGPIKPVDSKTLQGSYPGDHRAQAAPAVLPNNPGPREATGQFPLSSRTPAAAPAVQSDTEGSEGDRA